MLRALLGHVVFLLQTAVGAQDIHFSQFFNTPLALGPATIGAFEGDYRLNVIFRQQWRAVTIPYRTFALGGDAANAGGVQGLGLGAWMHNDKAGDSRMEQTHFSVGASWTERFGANDGHALAGGIQFGFTSIALDAGALSFDSQYNGFYYDPQRPSNEQFARSAFTHLDLHAGGRYSYTADRRTRLQVGLGWFNITKPAIGLLGGPGEPLDARTTTHLLGQFPVAGRLDLLPAVLYMAQGEYRELDVGANLRYILLDRYGLTRAVLFGLHVRAADAGFLYAGMEYDDWTFGVSYDINTSDLVPASRNRGGMELTVIRIFRERPAIPVRFKACPSHV
jgi:type IX secretion system PorP/SprF family membrane protein